MARSYSALFDLDGWPPASVQAGQPFISLCRYGAAGVAFREHRKAQGARRQAARERDTVALAFNGITGRWEPLDACEVCGGRHGTGDHFQTGASER